MVAMGLKLHTGAAPLCQDLAGKNAVNTCACVSRKWGGGGCSGGSETTSSGASPLRQDTAIGCVCMYLSRNWGGGGGGSGGSETTDSGALPLSQDTAHENVVYVCE